MKWIALLGLNVCLIAFCNCASSIRGKLGGDVILSAETEWEYEKEEMVEDFFKQIEAGGLINIQEVEAKLGFPARILNLKDGREVWIFEVSSGSWFLLFGTAETNQHVFVFNEGVLETYYSKKSGSKTGLFYPTGAAEPYL